jgi:hypothetical protein
MAALYAKCPKCGAETRGLEVCPKCGVIFAKYLKTAVGGAPVRAAKTAEEKAAGFRLSQWLFAVPDEVSSAVLYARAALLVLLAFYGAKLALMDVPSAEIGGSLMHYPIIVTHEFGHVVFKPFGEFMHNLGGALFQTLLPLIFGGILIVKNRDPFAASVTLWWAAVSIMDTAPYVYDAYDPQLILLSGRTGNDGSHDFVDVLGDLGLLLKAQPIGYGVRAVGAGVLVLALAWGAVMLWLQYGRKRDG